MKSITRVAATLLSLGALPAFAQTPAPADPPATTASDPAAPNAAAPMAGASPAETSSRPDRREGMRRPPAIDLMQSVVASFDIDSDGKITESEFAEFSRSVWTSKDTNEDGAIDEAEYKAWDWGFEYLAAERGAIAGFDAIKADLFSYWDVNGDGKISVHEIAVTAQEEFKNSDTDNDGAVNGRDLLLGSPTFNATLFSNR